MKTPVKSTHGQRINCTNIIIMLFPINTLASYWLHKKLAEHCQNATRNGITTANSNDGLFLFPGPSLMIDPCILQGGLVEVAREFSLEVLTSINEVWQQWDCFDTGSW